MNVGSDVIFRKNLAATRLTEGRLVSKSSLQDFEGKKPWWIVEYGKTVKKQMIIHESQIEGLR